MQSEAGKAGSGGRKPELLAPAGGLEAGLAALQYGADAIYLGLQRFSARADADNFDAEQLQAIVAYAHRRTPRRRVFVAVNTLMLQDELGPLAEALGTLAEVGVDAIIVQDLGVARLARRHFPELRLHSSTQLAVHNRAGVEALRALGFSRVTLARELTLEEIRECASVEGIEVEAFAHGALCYSYSGLCLYSSQLIGRSGNRGQCAYPCRDAWRAEDAPRAGRDGTALPRDPSQGFAFSMKDLALPHLVPALAEAGVSCLKIEGRKKSPLYVAATVAYYRKLLDRPVSDAERAAHEADIQTIFARPWTELYLRSRLDKDVADPDLVGHRGAPIGTVEWVGRAGREDAVRFQTPRPLTLHDGLQIDVPGEGRPFGFPIHQLRIVGGRGPARSVTEAPAGALVEVALPSDHPRLPTGAALYCSSSQDVKMRYRYARPPAEELREPRALDVALELAPEGLRVRGRSELASGPEGPSALEASVELPGSLDPARDAVRTAGTARAAFERLGDSRFALRDFEIADPHGLFVPVSRLNEARRLLVERLETALRERREARVGAARRELATQAARPGVGRAGRDSLRWSIKVDRVASLSAFEPADLERAEEVVVEIGRDGLPALREGLAALREQVGAGRLRLALPIVTRGWEDGRLRAKVAGLLEDGHLRWEGANLSAWTYLGIDPRDGTSARGLELAVDWPIYALNRSAVLQAMAMGARRVVLSPEDGRVNMRALLEEFAEQAVVVVYQDTPLFISESCVYANLAGGCVGKAQCPFEEMALVSSHGGRMRAIDQSCRTVLISERPFCLASRLGELSAAGARRVRADFIHRRYSPEEVVALWRSLVQGQSPAGHLANFERGLANGS